MPVGKFVSFGLFVDNAELPEYVIKDKTYCDVDLHGPTSFTIEDDAQGYPVLPFKITVRRLYEEVVWLKVFLDGQVICSKSLSCKTYTCDGVKVGNDIRELLFSLPRILEDQEKRNPLGKLAGTIRVVVYNVTPAATKQVSVYKMVPVYEDKGQGSKLQYLTKKDIQSFRGALFGGIVSREGRLTQKLVPTGRYRTVKGCKQGGSIMEEMTLHYRSHARMAVPRTVPLPRTQPEGPSKGDSKPKIAALKDIGNVTQQQTNPPAAVNAVPVKEEENKAAIDAKKANGDMKPSDGSAVNVDADPASKKIKLEVKPSDSCTVKVEASTASTKTDIDVKFDNSHDREEEDIIMCKEEDNSVICMGDDECCIFEVSNNISIIDLNDTIYPEDH